MKNITPLFFPVIIAIGFSACDNGNPVTSNDMGKITNNESTMKTLTHLFDAQLKYNDKINVDIPMEGRTGDFIGKGEGTINGEKISGTILWQFYAEDCAYLWVKEGQPPPADQHLCKTNPGGIITTTDGAKIKFDAKGYGFRGADSTRSHIWFLTAALQFNTDDERYKWLNTKLGVWEGRFDEKANTANYRAYIQQKTK